MTLDFTVDENGNRIDLDGFEQVTLRMERRAYVTAGEQKRIAEVKARGSVPILCGPEIVSPAPARGFVAVFDDVIFEDQGNGKLKPISAAYEGRVTVRVGDAFDVMTSQAKSKNAALPFTQDQVDMGRIYHGVYESHDSAGIQGSDFNRVGGGSGGDGSFIDTVMDQGRLLERLERLIGDGSAMVVRRVRPSSRGTRVTITDRELVDMVCIKEKTITDVLVKNGWAVNGDTVKALRLALCDALDRMMGHKVGSKMQAKTFGLGASMDEWR